MPGEQSVRSDEASDFRKILERSSPNTSSFRSELLSELDSHKARRTKVRSSSHRRHRSHRDSDRGIDINVLGRREISRLLAHDEIEAVDMRNVLIKTSERLDQETRRANDAESRAREAEARVLAMQIAKKAAEAEIKRDQELLKAHKVQLDVARQEILRAQKELDNMATEKERAEEEAAKDRSNARAMAKALEIHQALEQGRQEGKIQGFVDGRKEGWYIGTRDGRRATLRQLALYDDDASVSSPSVSHPPASFDRDAAAPSNTFLASRSGPPPAPLDPSTQPNQNDGSSAPSARTTTPKATSIQTTVPKTTQKRSGTFTQHIKARLRHSPDPKLPFSSGSKPSEAASASIRTAPSVERPANGDRPVRPTSSASRDTGYASPVPFNPPPSPHHAPTSPLPGGFIPLQENGRMALPAPHELEPPPSPHSPSLPLPPEITHNGLLSPRLQPTNIAVNVAPTITVQEPTPPEPPVKMPEPISMPEPHPASAHPKAMAENNVKPSQVRARDSAVTGRSESPPLPPLPTEYGNKGKQRQRSGRSRSIGGLQAPGRSSPSDTSTEFSQFEIVTGAMPSEHQPRGLGRTNPSQLSVILEGGSTAAESPEPLQPIGVRQQVTPRTHNDNIIDSHGRDEFSYPPATQGILNDPREYGDIPEAQLSSDQIARRQAIADQLRWSSPDRESDIMNGVQKPRDDVSIKSSTTHASGPRKRAVNLKMPERLGPSRDVEVLEKQAAMYDAFGTGQKFPSFDSPSSPDEVPVPTRAPTDFTRGHRRAMSSATSVPEITIEPPSRSSSNGSKFSRFTGNRSPQPISAPIPAPGSPSRRHSMQGPTATPSVVSLPHSVVQMPMTLSTPHHGDFVLPAGFVPMSMPMQVPPEPVEEISSNIPSKTQHVQPMQSATMSKKTPKMTSGGLGGPSNYPAHTPAGIPLPLSTATTTRGLPDNGSSAPRGTVRSSHSDLPNVPVASYEPAPLPPGVQYPPSFAPARVPLPESVAGNSPRASVANQTPWGGWNSLGAGATPGAPVPPALGGDRPMALYAGDGGPHKKVSSSSLRSSHYKSFEPSTYLDPAYLASADSVNRNDTEIEVHRQVRTPSRAGSVCSTKSGQEQKSAYATSVENVTDEDEPSRTRGI